MEVSKDLEKFQKEMLETYSCIICKGFALDIQTSNCACNVIFCKTCVKPILNCPLCNEKLKVSPIGFRTLNILREISEYKKYEDEIKLEVKKKIPSIEDIKNVWAGACYTEGTTYEGKTREKAQEISRRLIFGILNMIKVTDNQIRTWIHVKDLADRSYLKLPNWFPNIIMYKGETMYNFVRKFCAQYKLSSLAINSYIVLSFNCDDISDAEIPYNLCELYLEKYEK